VRSAGKVWGGLNHPFSCLSATGHHKVSCSAQSCFPPWCSASPHAFSDGNTAGHGQKLRNHEPNKSFLLLSCFFQILVTEIKSYLVQVASVKMFQNDLPGFLSRMILKVREYVNSEEAMYFSHLNSS
jgi:hypothetical protein